MKTKMHINALASLLACLLFSVSFPNANAFLAPQFHHNQHPISTRTCATVEESSSSSEDALSEPQQTVHGILQQLHESNYPFRLVVVGNGAILETTSPLGPTFKVGTSPRTGEPLVTFASEDQSFEFHLMLAQVSKIVMTAKTEPKLMQIFRFLTAKGKPMCSLILADKSDDAQKWFATMVEQHNQGDVQL